MRNKKQVISLTVALVGSITTSPAPLKALSLSAADGIQGSTAAYNMVLPENFSQGAEQDMGKNVWDLSENHTGDKNLTFHLTHEEANIDTSTAGGQEVSETPDLIVPPVTTEPPHPITPTMPPLIPIKPDITVPTIPPVTVEPPKPITPTAPPLIPMQPDFTLPTVAPLLPEYPAPITPVVPIGELESLGQETSNLHERADEKSKKEQVEKLLNKGISKPQVSASHTATLSDKAYTRLGQGLVALEGEQTAKNTNIQDEGSQVEKEAVRKHSIAVNAASAGGAVTGVCASALFLSALKKLSWLRQFFGK
ncbi:MAG TPA: hypothetical protein DCZ00_01410 [Lactococcus sp.]|uniref:hypothetical protein n=1 Tax=Lactococcus TaxID=1357 RepID=UPI000E8DF02B|nr:MULTISPECIES: hypothetical protein [unclassified Lactococcus]HBC90083.1 hypothetical protein [Lactococcus sp.]